MKLNILLSIYILLSIAAQARPASHDLPVEKKETVMEYVSLGNDFAEIRMELYSNGKFKIVIHPQEGKSLKLKGHWEKENNFYVLKFRKTQLAVNKIFNMNDPNRFQVMDELHIRFSGHLSSLWIWGIQCKKSEKIALL